MDPKDQIAAASDHLGESGVHNDLNVDMEVFLLKGQKFNSEIVLSKLMN